MKPQDFIIHSLTQMFSDMNPDDYVGDMSKDDAYTYILKSFCDKYSNSFYDKTNNSIFNMYHNNIKIDDIEHLKKSVLISQKAYEKLYNLNLKKNYDDYKKTRKKTFGAYFHEELQLYFEHLTPMSQPRIKIVEISRRKHTIDVQDVEECFKYSALALITREESKVLDGKNGYINDSDIDKLKKWKAKYPDYVDKASVEEAIKLINSQNSKNERRLKNHGNGLIRIVHMVSSGVNFVDKDGKVLCDKDLLYRLNNFKFDLDQFG